MSAKQKIKIKFDNHIRNYNIKAKERLEKIADCQLKNINMYSYRDGHDDGFNKKEDAFFNAVNKFKNKFKYGIIKDVKIIYSEKNKLYFAWAIGQVAWDYKMCKIIQ